MARKGSVPKSVLRQRKAVRGAVAAKGKGKGKGSEEKGKGKSKGKGKNGQGANLLIDQQAADELVHGTVPLRFRGVVVHWERDDPERYRYVSLYGSDNFVLWFCAIGKRSILQENLAEMTEPCKVEEIDENAEITGFGSIECPQYPNRAFQFRSRREFAVGQAVRFNLNENGRAVRVQ